MSVLWIEGSHSLDGRIKIQGSKNGVLPVMAASLLHEGTTILEHVPKIQDVFCMMGILASLGCKCTVEEERLVLDAGCLKTTEIPENLAGQMRSSVMLLGPLLARSGRVSTSLPGGCRIGKRPVDLHLAGLRALGACVGQEGADITAWTPKCGLTGGEVRLSYPSVGATENILMAAAGASGETILHGAAREPEIEILCAFLNQLGVKVRGAGTSCISVMGKGVTRDTIFPLPGDRIVAGTYLGAVMSAGGSVLLERAPILHMGKTLELAKAMGAEILPEPGGLRVIMKGRPRAAELRTGPYPEFPTDMQSVMMAVMARANGISCIRETVFESRFSMAKELRKLGADIIIEDNLARVAGRDVLTGTFVEASDLRGGAALAVACLGALGESRVGGYEHISRGYEDISRDLSGVGARIALLPESEST